MAEAFTSTLGEPPARLGEDVKAATTFSVDLTRLSRMSVYILLSTIFVVLVGLTVALIVFTPVKYYIPGYGNVKMDREYRQLKYVVDSLEKQVSYHEQYNNSIKKVLSGNTEVKLDTAQLQLPKEEESND